MNRATPRIQSGRASLVGGEFTGCLPLYRVRRADEAGLTEHRNSRPDPERVQRSGGRRPSHSVVVHPSETAILTAVIENEIDRERGAAPSTCCDRLLQRLEDLDGSSKASEAGAAFLHLRAHSHAHFVVPMRLRHRPSERCRVIRMLPTSFRQEWFTLDRLHARSRCQWSPPRFAPKRRGPRKDRMRRDKM